MLNVLAIDDEPLALKVLQSHLEKIPFVEKIITTTKILEAFNIVERENIKLIYLDIQMPDLTGLQFMKMLNERSKVIITTAHQQFALDGYEYNVVDYLLKPISFERLFTATKKAVDLLTQRSLLQSADAHKQIMPRVYQDFIFVRTSYKLQKVVLEDILYIEGGKEYTTFYTTNEKILSLTSLSKIMEILPEGLFVRVHKSYIVAVRKISTIEKQRLIINRETIPIGETYKDILQKYIREI